MKELGIGLCGLGTVGGGVFNVLARNNHLINQRANAHLKIVHIGARRDNPNVDVKDKSIKVSRDIFDVVRDPNVDVVVELIGGTTTAFDLVMKAIANGKQVITANKALIAEHGAEIFAAAEKQGVSILFEAAVAGGIPIIKALREGLAANKIEWLAGIINGTTNFILTEMSEKGREFNEVLKEAQELGYAEADPTFDVEGIDAAQKLIILASIAFSMPLEMKKVFTEGVTTLDICDVEFAKELGYTIRHLGIARKRERGVELRVHPALVPNNQLMASVSDVMNAVMVMGNSVGPTLYCGPGAGSEATASSVISDLVDVARDSELPLENRIPYLGVKAKDIKPQPVLSIDEIETEYYLRITAKDKPGVLSEISKILSDAGISIEALTQKEPQTAEAETVPIILLTNKVKESALRTVVKKIEATDVVSEPVVTIRIEMLAQ